MKRFTETNIWDEDWFLELPKEYKLFWFYLKDKCNHAGIWRPNLRLFEAIIEVKINLDKALDYFNSDKVRIFITKNNHWYILDFFSFQYGQTFNPLNRVHKSIELIYNQEGINLTSIRGLKEVKEGVKDKDKEDIINIDYNRIVNLFNSICKSLSKIQTLSDTRKKKIKTRFGSIGGYEGFEKLFILVENTPFLKGDNKNNWKADFDWLIDNDTNYLKIFEGKYKSKVETQSTQIKLL